MDVVTTDKNTTSEDRKIYILKGRFKSNSLNFYGLFLIIFNTRMDLDVNHVIVSTYSSVYDLEPHFGWERYEEFMVNSKWKGNYNPNMTASIEDLFSRLSTEEDDQKNRLYESLKKYDHDNVDIFMFDIINRIIHDKNLILETGIQEVSEEEYRETSSKESSSSISNVSEDGGLTTGEGAVTLLIKLILAPVSGKPIYELKIGDIIMTKIIPNTDRANYFIDLLDLRVENIVKPVPCKVIDIKSEGKGEPLEIITEIGPGIYGKCIEDERQVKLRMYDSEVDGAVAKNDLSENADEKVAKESGSFAAKIAKKQNVDVTKFAYIAIGVFVIMALLFMAIYLFLL